MPIFIPSYLYISHHESASRFAHDLIWSLLPEIEIEIEWSGAQHTRLGKLVKEAVMADRLCGTH